MPASGMTLMAEKTWETLFQTAGFMRFLLQNQLQPEDDSGGLSQAAGGASPYVLDSLFDLLAVTLEAIQKAGRSATQHHSITTMCNTFQEELLREAKVRLTEKESLDGSPARALVNGGISTNSKSSLVIHQSLILSKTFIDLNNRITSGQESCGFYCLPCDSSFSSVNSWNLHSRNEPAHLSARAESQGIICTQCEFLVYGLYEIGSVYFDYHTRMVHQQNNESSDQGVKQSNVNKNSGKFYCGYCQVSFKETDDWERHLSQIHDIENGEKKRRIPTESSDIESNLSRASSMSHVSSLFNETKKKKPHRNKRPDNIGKYIICQSFIDLNNKIHSDDVRGAFYCRPCEKSCFVTVSWEKHTMERKHMSFMSDPNFKNLLALCDYCGLNFVGSDRAVKEYMLHHSVGHGRVPSYKRTLIEPPQEEAGGGYKRSSKSRQEGNSRTSSFEHIQEPRRGNERRNEDRPKGNSGTSSFEPSHEEAGGRYERRNEDRPKGKSRTSTFEPPHGEAKGRGYERPNGDRQEDNSRTSSFEPPQTRERFTLRDHKPKPERKTMVENEGNVSQKKNETFTEEVSQEEWEPQLQELYETAKRYVSAGEEPPFAGFCSQCYWICTDGFEWMDHLDEHPTDNTDFKEFKLPKYNVSYFGRHSI